MHPSATVQLQVTSVLGQSRSNLHYIQQLFSISAASSLPFECFYLFNQRKPLMARNGVSKLPLPGSRLKPPLNYKRARSPDEVRDVCKHACVCV